MAEWTKAAACHVEKRRSARVDEWTGLENRSTRNGTGGSNPSSSAFLRGREKLQCRKRHRGFESHPHRIIMNTPRHKNPTHRMPANISQNDDPVFAWEAHEYEYIEKHPKWYWVMGIILLAIVIYAIVTNSILMAITFILIGMLGYYFAERDPRLIQMEISPEGVVVDRTLYEYDDLKSFWIFYEVEAGFKVLSLHSQKTFLPHIHIPIGDANPILIREVLLNYIPELRQEMTFVDRMSLLIGL
jgi:hypothetical protein